MKYSTSEFEKLVWLLKNAEIGFATYAIPSFFEDENKRLLIYFGTAVGQIRCRAQLGLADLSASIRKCSVINYGIGSKEGLLEMSGLCSLLPDRGVEVDGCVGKLYAEDIFSCIKSDWEKSWITITILLSDNGTKIVWLVHKSKCIDQLIADLVERELIPANKDWFVTKRYTIDPLEMWSTVEENGIVEGDTLEFMSIERDN